MYRKLMMTAGIVAMASGLWACSGAKTDSQNQQEPASVSEEATSAQPQNRDEMQQQLIEDHVGLILQMDINGQTVFGRFEETQAANEFIDLLIEGPITIELEDYEQFEKVGAIGHTFTAEDQEISAQPGDILLYQGDQMVINYKENTWDYTRLAKMDAALTPEEIQELLGDQNVTIEFSIASKAR